MFITMTDMLQKAREAGYAVPAFDVSNDEMIRAVAEVCKEENAPALFMLLKADLGGVGLPLLVEEIRTVCEYYGIPACVHLDHAGSEAEITRAIDAGVTSVMYDGSSLSYEQNLENTLRIVRIAHSRGVSTEAELGHVANAIAGVSESGQSEAEPSDIESCLTDPEQVADFTARTGVDSLAVAIGTAHGVYVHEPKLHFDLLEKINRASLCPLVLHGGSGTPDKDVQHAISLGITKINIFSEVLYAQNSGLRDRLNATENLSAWPSLLFSTARERMREVIRHKIRTFGARGRA